MQHHPLHVPRGILKRQSPEVGIVDVNVLTQVNAGLWQEPWVVTTKYQSPATPVMLPEVVSCRRRVPHAPGSAAIPSTHSMQAIGNRDDRVWPIRDPQGTLADHDQGHDDSNHEWPQVTGEKIGQ